MEVEARRRGLTVYEVLNERLDDLARRERVTHPAQLTRDLHVQPDFHGNRSPRANPGLRGMISGLTLSATGDDLARLYLSAIQAVACGTHHILKTLNARGYAISTLFACGGGTKNPVFLREHADVTGCRIVLPREPEAVLLGSAVLGAVASGRHPSVLAAMAAMNHAGREVTPGPAIVQRYHSAKYQVFHAMHDNFVQCRKLMGIK
jgi:ribulose kinase